MAAEIQPMIEALRTRLEEGLEGMLGSSTSWGIRTGVALDTPRLSLRTDSKNSEIDKDYPPKWTVMAEAKVVFAVDPTAATSPDPLLHDVAERLEDALLKRTGEAHPDYWTNLGGLCRYACPGGQVVFQQGAVTGQASVTFMIRIEASPR